MCVRYFHRSKLKEDFKYMRYSLKLFYKKKYISLYSYFWGLVFLKMNNLNLISNALFIKLNRYFTIEADRESYLAKHGL